MFKRFITIMMIVSLLCSMMALGLSAGAYYQPDIRYGDVNGNGVVDTNDARLALRIASGVDDVENEAQLKRTDLNFDGVITIFDARQILRGVAGLVSLQPSGAISGFDGGGVFANEETLVAFFNAYANRIKVTEKNGKQYIAPGMTKTESDTLTKLNIKELELPAFDFGLDAEGIAGKVEEALTEDDKENETTEITAGSDDFSLVSVEGESYVSNLSASDIYGSRVVYDKDIGQVTMEIALPDTEVELVEQSAYAKVLNAAQLLEEQDTVLMSLIKGSSEETAILRELKNCVLTLVVDVPSDKVISYTISYESKVYVAETNIVIGSIFEAKLKEIQFEKDHIVIYDNFEW